MASEKAFENKIKKYLKERGCYVIKYWGGGTYTKSGVPDILACVGGRFVGIEVKSERGRASELQMYNLDKIHEAGGMGILAYPQDWETVKRLLDNLLEERS